QEKRRPCDAHRRRDRRAQRFLARGAGEGRQPRRRAHERPDAAGPEDQRGPLTGTPSARLRAKLAVLVVPFARAYGALVEHPHLRELWPEYLILQHQIIRATVPLT